jgi:hypothetical protein
MDIRALQLASRFSLPPNSLGYCGKNTAPEKFKRCAIYGTCEGVEDEIKEFIVLFPYLKTLSQITKFPIFSHKVVEAYWLGNDELETAKPKHYSILLENFKKQGVPVWLTEELSNKEPRKFIPNHLFQILHVGVGRASGAVPYNLGSINNCMIRWGKVEKTSGKKLWITLNSLKVVGKRYKTTLVNKTLPFVETFLGPVKVGDIVAVHWNQVVKILTVDEEGKLSSWTRTVLDSFRPK